MGNSLSPSLSAAQERDLPSYLLELQDYQFAVTLSGGKILKTLQCRSDEDSVVIKLYIKRDKDLDLSRYESRLDEIRDAFHLQQQPGVIPIIKLENTDKAAYLVRQFFSYNLYDRFHSHPYLTVIEKRWFAFQILSSLAQMHALNIRHGDLKTENIMVTTWNWIFITDLAFYKPTYLPADNPADYSFYFETSTRRRCYLAPERFYSAGHEKPKMEARRGGGGSDGLVTEAMDIFSAGCCIAEVFLEGEPLFDLPQLLSYRDGQYDPTPVINKIPYPDVRTLVKHMIQSDPTKRLSAKLYLQKFRGHTFPNYFPFLYHFFAKLLSPDLVDLDMKIQAVKTAEAAILKEITGVVLPVKTTPTNATELELVKDQSTSLSAQKNVPRKTPAQMVQELQTFISQVEASTQKLRDWINEPPTSTTTSTPSSTSIAPFSPAPVKPSSINTSITSPIPSPAPSPSSTSTDDDTITTPTMTSGGGNGLTMIIALVCSCIRHVRYPITKLLGLELLLEFGVHVDDDVRLGRIVPYLVSMLSDPVAIVRATAVTVLTKTLSCVESFPSTDAHIFPEYILPALSRFPSDSEELVRLAYSQCIADLAETARKFLDISQLMKLHAVNNDPSTPTSTTSIIPTNTNVNEGSYDVELSLLQDTVLKLVIDMISMGGSRVKRSLLIDITRLCMFLGRRRVNNDLLPHLITVLNDRDWQLRTSFFQHIVGVSVFVGRIAFQDFILPCIEQALFDVEEFTIQRAVHALTALCQLGLFERRIMLQLVHKIGPLLCHPSTWIRNETINFVTAMASALGLAKSFAFLIPALQPFLKDEIVEVTRNTLVQSLKSPLSRAEFKQAINPRESLDASALPSYQSQSQSQSQSVDASISSSSFVTASNHLSTPSPARVNQSSPHTPPIGMPRDMSFSAPQHGVLPTSSGTNSATGTASSSPANPSQLDAKLDGFPSDSTENLASSSSILFQPSSTRPLGQYSERPLDRDSNFMSDDALRPAMLSYLQRLSAAMHTKSMWMSPHTNAQPVSMSTASSIITASSDSSDLGGEDDDIQHYATLEEEVQVYALEVEKTVPDSAVVFSPIDKVQQDLFDSLGVQMSVDTKRGGKPDGSSTTSSSAPVSSSPPGEPLHARLDPKSVTLSPMHPSTSSTSLSPSPISTTGIGGRRPVMRRTMDTVPEYIQRALAIPAHPPNLGVLRSDTLTVSSFYRNYHALEANTTSNSSSNSNTSANNMSEIDPRSWRPRGVLVSTLQEHKLAVNALSVSRDNLFMVTGSDDGTVKIWDCQKLKFQALARSQLTYQQRGRITSATVCDSSHSVASASDQGTVHVFKVEYAPMSEETSQRYIGFSEVKKIDSDVEGACLVVDHFNTITESLLVYGTVRGHIHGWDLRSRIESFLVHIEPAMGVLTTMEVGPTPYCLVAGTSRGFIVTWDLRFQIPIQIWRHSAKTRITALVPQDVPSILPRDPRTQHFQHPTKGPLIFAAAEGTNQIAGFDLYTGECRVVLRATDHASNRIPDKDKKPIISRANTVTSRMSVTATSTSSSTSSATKGKLRVSPLSLPSLRSFVRSENSSSLSSVDEPFIREMAALSTSTTPDPSITAMLCCRDSFVLTAGTDRVVRFWDMRDPLESYRISTEELGDAHLRYHGRLENNTVVLEETLIVASDHEDETGNSTEDPKQAAMRAALARRNRGQVPPPTAHQADILAMKAIEYPQKMLATAARDGCVKVWV